MACWRASIGLPVVPHVGDMGQIHQHLVLFNHIALGHELVFLEYIPHLREYFVHPVRVEDGVYRTSQEPGCSTDLKLAPQRDARSLPRTHQPTKVRPPSRKP